MDFKYTKLFIDHNLENFKKINYKTGNKILVEIYNYKPSTIPISYISNILAKKYNADIVGYYPSFLKTKDKFKNFFFENYNPYGLHKIYQSFGVQKHIVPKKK